MPDPTQAPEIFEAARQLVVEGAGVVGAERGRRALARLLGPAWDEVAEAIRESVVAYRVRNLERIAELAERKRPGAGLVSPRVAIRLLEDASACDEAIVVEYMSGVLASSRSPDGRDDRGVAWTALISSLSSVQLRLHHALYEATRVALRAPGSTPSSWTIKDIVRHTLLIPTASIIELFEWHDGIDFSEQELVDAVSGLRRNDLVGDYFAFGEGAILRETPNGRGFPSIPPDGGLIFSPSFSGVGLFMWGHGLGNHCYNDFLTAEELHLTEVDVPIDHTGVMAVTR